MKAYVEIREGGSARLVAVESDRCTLGKADSNDIVVTSDPALSRLHAVLERYEAGWSIRDVGSKNGTQVNGERILGERRLNHGDEIRVANTILLFKLEQPDSNDTMTQAAEAPPDLTRREKEVLIALCRPVLSGSVFTRPASIKEIAEELFVTENAVKQHLGRLYDKFRVFSGSDPRPLSLANEAVRRGAVTLADLKPGG